jgi:hypothetical protein
VDSVDLKKLAEVFRRADSVVTLAEVHGGNTQRLAIGLRHDVDGNPGAFENAVAMAGWEAEQGYRSTYYFLHGTYFWGPGMADGLHKIASQGHEIGFHNNALAIARRTDGDCFSILDRALGELRAWSGEAVVSISAHGDRDAGYGTFMNYQMWEEGYSTYVKNNFMSPEELGITPRPMADFGLEIQGDWIPRPHYLTDSGGSWGAYAKLDYIHTLDEVVEGYPYEAQLIVLQHPDWWPEALYR